MSGYLKKLNRRPNMDFKFLGKDIKLSIDGFEVKEGDRLTVLNERNQIEYKGTVKFMLYKDKVDWIWGIDDEDGHIDFWHLGFVLDCSYPKQIYTLVDIFHEAKINNWKIINDV